MTNGVTLADAQSIVVHTLAEARRLQLRPMMVVVLDARATIKAAAAEDGAGTGRYAIAFGKANGCLALGTGARAIAARAAKLPAFFNALAASVPGGLIPMLGGVLIRNDAGDIIGAVGTTGDTGDHDEQAALAGITQAGLIADAGAG